MSRLRKIIIIIIIIMPLFTHGNPFTNTVLSQGAVLFKNMLIEIGKLSIQNNTIL